MCIILSCAAGVRPATSIIEECFHRNPDGAGLMYPADGLVQIRKGFMSLDSYLAAIADVPDDVPLVLHMRIGTGGGNIPGLTHPFPVCEGLDFMHATDIRIPLAVAHNGVLSDYTADVKPGVSDTVAYVRDVALYLADDTEVRRCGGLAVSRLAADMLRDTSQGSRLAIMDGHGHVRLTGAGWEDVQPGIHASNDSWRPYEPVYRYSWSNRGTWRSCTNWPDWDDLDDLEQPMLWDDQPTTAAAANYADENYGVCDIFEEYYAFNNCRQYCPEYTECRYHCARCGSVPYCATDDDLKDLKLLLEDEAATCTA